MLYSFNAQSKGVKIFLQSGREDYGTTDNPTYMMNGVIQCPPGTYGYMGIEKMYFEQPALFPGLYLNTNMSIQYTPFAGDTIVPVTSQTAPITLSMFTETFTFNGIGYPTVLADIGYDGSGGYVLASYLDCVLSTLSNQVVPPDPTYNECYPTFDFSCSLFLSWRNLSNVTSTSVQISKVDMITAWLRANCPPLSLFFNRTYANTTYSPNEEIQTITVTLTDSVPNAGLVSRIFNIPSGNLTLTQTSPDPISNNAGFLAAVHAPSTAAPIALNVNGLNYVKMFCNMSQGYKEAHLTLPGCVDSTLLGTIPVLGLPGNWKYYISPATHERIAIHGSKLDALSLWFTDDQDRPLTALNNYAVVIGIDFVEREELAREPLMIAGRK